MNDNFKETNEGTYAGAFMVEGMLEKHPANIMPPMTREEFEEFKVDISGNGLLEPIVIFQGKVLDGWQRYQACFELDIDAWARKWEGGMNPVEYVLSKNCYRRHMTGEQLSDARSAAIEYHVRESRERNTVKHQQLKIK